MPKITEPELKTQIKSEELKNFYLFFGQETYLVEGYTEKVAQKICGKNPSPFNELRLDGENLTIEQIYEAVESFPIAATKKCVIIKNLNAEAFSSENLKALEDLLCDLPEFCVLIFSYTSVDFSTKKTAKWKTLISLAKKHAYWLECVKMSGAALEKQLISWAKKMGSEISRENAAKIIAFCGEDLTTLKNEVHKLVAFAGAEITAQDIEKCVVKNFETTVFLLAKSVISGDAKGAYEQLNILLGQKEEPTAILAVLASSYIDIYRVKICQDSGAQVSSLSKFFDYKNKEFKLTNAQRLAKNFSAEKIKSCLELLLNTDLALKTTQLNKKILMQELVAKLITR